MTVSREVSGLTRKPDGNERKESMLDLVPLDFRREDSGLR